MKKLFLAALIFMFCTTANADLFSWTHSEGATGYKIYYTDLTDGGSKWSKDVGYVDNFDLPLIPGHEYVDMYCAAYNLYGESDPSNKIDHWSEFYTPTDNPQITETAEPVPPINMNDTN